MANTTTTPASYITVDPQADECRENVPPRDPKADDSSKLENTENFILQLQEDGVNDFVSSTPALKIKTSDFQAKSLLSGVQYSLSPVSKNLNIWNKSGSPEPFKLRNSPNLAVPSSFHAANYQKSNEDSRTQKNGEDASMINDECLPEVTLFDITSDSMIHPTMNDSGFPERRHATPQLYGKKSKTSDNQNSFCTKVGESFQSALSFRGIFNDYLQDISLLEITRDSPVGHMSFMDMEDVRATSDHNDQIMTEKSNTITIEEVSSTSRNCSQSSRQNSIKSALEVIQDVTLENSKSSFESSGQKVEKSQNPDNGTQAINITRDLCSSCDASKTVDISSSGIERSTHEVCPEQRGNPDCIEGEMVTKKSQRSSESETGGQKLEMYQSSDTHCIQASNITQEKNPGCDTSVQTAHLSSDMGKFTPELESEPKKTPEELPTCCDTESTNKESQQTLKPNVSANGTFEVEQSSMQTVSFVKNETLDLLSTNVSKAKDVEESGDQQTSVDFKTEASFVVHQSSSDEKETTFAVAQNATVDEDVLQKSKLQIGSALEKTAAPLSHQNSTFDYKLPSQLDGTITLAEISSNDSQSGLGSFSTSKARSATFTLKDDCSQNNLSNLQINETAEPETKKDGSPNMTFETAEPETKKGGSPNMTFETAEPETKKGGSPNMTFETAEPETKKGGSPNMTFKAAEPETMKDGSPNMTNEAVEPETKKGGSPNMTNEAAEPETKKGGSPNMTFKAAEPETTKDGSPNMTNDAAEPQTMKDGSPNMTNEAAEPETKKDGIPNMTFEAPLQPANVSIYLSQSGLSNFDESLDLGPQCLATSTPMVAIKLFPSETKREAGHIPTVQKKLYGKTPIEPSNAIKLSNIIGDRKTFFKQPTAKILHPASKIASELLKRNPSATSTGLPVKLQRPDGEAAKSSAAPKEQEKNSSSYNLRSLASKLKPPSGLQRPQVSGIPVGLPKAPPSLRAAPCSSTEKPSGPAAANSVMKMPPGKRHPLAKGEALPVSKRKKTDASTTEAPVSVSAAASELKPGKQPTASHRSAPDKSSRTGAAATKTAASYDAISRGKGFKRLAANPRANHVKPQSQGCIKCEHLSQENERLKEVLRKHKIPLNG